MLTGLEKCSGLVLIFCPKVNFTLSAQSGPSPLLKYKEIWGKKVQIFNEVSFKADIYLTVILSSKYTRYNPNLKQGQYLLHTSTEVSQGVGAAVLPRYSPHQAFWGRRVCSVIEVVCQVASGSLNLYLVVKVLEYA